MKQHIRAFAIGLLTSGVLLLAIYLISNPSANRAEDMDPEELISVLEDKGYAVLTQDQYIAHSVNKETSDAGQEDETSEDAENEAAEDENADEENENGNSDENEEGTEEDEVIETKVKLESGMPPSNISDSLEDAGIIDDAMEFNDYLEDNDYSGSVKPGTYKVNSEMSFDEIAEIITTYSE